ncbi:2'-5' RNA ligase family protein [Microtetraspora malaysiensis]|uniref:2'-5' RNA ligase family protein n=1 Tax=Microtetraspora malaysiensis TaxID=161358 RepID=UPI0008323F58|nr:2'-5' RNA ligase family protein [Microtetraspora malaysiensis]
MSRLFVALSPPAGVLAEIAAEVGPRRGEWPGLRWVDDALWHVTLAFLGEVPDAVLPELDVRLARAAARHQPMRVWFGSAGAFPSLSRARTFWVGLNTVPSDHGETEVSPSAERHDSSPGAETREGPRGHSGAFAEPMVRLAASLAAGARRAGAAEVDRKPFHPHLTLARSRHGDDLRPLVSAMSAFRGREWDADVVHLVCSHLGSHVRYEQVAVYPLGGRD